MREKPGSYYLAELLDFLIDADRLDYLRRDAIHTYDDPPMSQKWSYIIQGTRSQWLQDPKNRTESSPLKRLVFNIDHKEIIEPILTFRRDMYDGVYEHPHTVILDGMLTHALFYVMRQNRVIPAYERDPSFLEVALAASREVWRLTDDDLLYFMLEMSDPTSPEGRQALELVLDIYRDRPYKEILPRHTIPRDRMEDAEANLDNGLIALDEAIRQQTAKQYGLSRDEGPWEAAYALSDDERLEVSQRVLGMLTRENRWGHFEDLLLLDFTLVRGHFLRKYEVERSFWTLLLQTETFHSLLEDYVAARYGSQDVTKWIDESVPLVHIALTGHCRRTAREMREHTTEPGQKHERLAFYDDRLSGADRCAHHHTAGEGCMYSFYTPDPATAESFEAWNAILSGPAELVDDPNAAAMIGDLWSRFVFGDRDWISAIRK